MLVTGKPVKLPKVILLSSLNDQSEWRVLIDKLVAEIDSQVRVVGEFLNGEECLLEKSNSADMAIVFGGDGSILRAARQLGKIQIPVLGVNLGKLGFLADVQPAKLHDAIASVERGDFRIIEHIMLDCQVLEAGVATRQAVALNEVSILGGPPFQIQQIDLYVDGQLAASYNCDGLIVSTPVGSTAHNLSAGGPIVRKDLAAVVISPISPHTLTVRSVVDTADRVFELVAHPLNDSATVVVDGNVICSLKPNQRVRITRSELKFSMIEVSSNNYYRTLREKLGWGVGFSTNPAIAKNSKKKK